MSLNATGNLGGYANNSFNMSNTEMQINMTNKTYNTSYYNQTLMNRTKDTMKKKNNLDRPVIIRESELSSVSNNKKEDGVIIKTVSLDNPGKYRINNEMNEEPLHEKFLYVLLNPSEWLKKPDQGMEKFMFKTEDIVELTQQCIDVVMSQPMVLRVNTPVKVFGDIHGQYIDLMTFFARWGEPKDGPNGDIHIIDYLFLGDYVDRGNMSLETMCLLLALKVKYPDRIHLLRGNHEDKLINSNFGFYEECQYRLGEDPMAEDSAFYVLNEKNFRY
jgi:hypothetical protein